MVFEKMNDTKKRTLIALLSCTGVIFLAFNIVGFAIPYLHRDWPLFIAIMVFTDVMIFWEAGLMALDLFRKKGALMFLEYPAYVMYALGALIQAVFTLIFMLVSAFYTLPLWVVIVLETLLLAYVIVQIILVFLQKSVPYGC
jgi:hypothetical protein